MSQSESAPKSQEQGFLAKSFGFESIGKALGIESLGKIVPSLKKAMEIANKNNDKSFLDKIGIFVSSFTDEMDRLDGDKKQIAKDTTEKVKGIISEAPKTQAPSALTADAANAPSSAPESTHETHLEIDPNEPFVRGEDHFGHKVVLRKSAMKAFKNAMEIAEKKGMRLRVTSSYRSFKSQEKLHAHGVEKYGDSETASKWVAKAGHSNHHTGGTIDVAVMVKDSNGRWKGGTRHANQKFLWDILPKADFVNYAPEPWHWEIYSERWRAKKHVAGNVYKKQASLNV